jgi:ssDNA-binding Zn-finger/Zn-ribbon topoisomerase 1
MLKWWPWWPWRREPKKERFWACPKCRKFASEEYLDKALAQDGDDLKCENCGKTSLRFNWAHTGQTEILLGRLKGMTDQSGKSPRSN